MMYPRKHKATWARHRAWAELVGRRIARCETHPDHNYVVLETEDGLVFHIDHCDYDPATEWLKHQNWR